MFLQYELPLSSYQEILLYLLIQLVQFALSILQCSVGLMVALYPLVKVLLIQILVSKSKSPQPIPCKFLQKFHVRILIWMNAGY